MQWTGHPKRTVFAAFPQLCRGATMTAQVTRSVSLTADKAHRDTTVLFRRIEYTTAASDYARGNGNDTLADTLEVHRATLFAALNNAGQENVR